LIGFATLFMANRGGSPGGRSGSSSDGATCTTAGGCHGSGTSTVTSQEFLSSDIPSSGYEPGKTYNLTISPVKSNTNVWGFEMMAEDSSGKAIGEFMNGSDANLINNNSSRITHKFASSDGNGGRTWVVQWKAPAIGSGKVSFYTACLAANGNGNTGGDVVLVDTLIVPESELSSLEYIVNLDFTIYPNPASNTLKILKSYSQSSNVCIFNALGDIVYSSTFEKEIQISKLAPGEYFLKLTDDDVTITKKFVKL